MGGRNGDYFNRKEKVRSLKKKFFVGWFQIERTVCDFFCLSIARIFSRFCDHFCFDLLLFASSNVIQNLVFSGFFN